MIDKKTVKKIAKLARLRFNSEELEEITENLAKITDNIEKLQDLDFDKNAEGIRAYKKDIFRKDEVGRTLDHEKTFRNAPQRELDFFSVPKTVKKK